MGSGTVLDSARLKYRWGKCSMLTRATSTLVLLASMETASWAVWSAANVSESASTISSRLRGIENATEIRASVEESVRNSAYEIIERSAPRILASSFRNPHL